MYSLEFYRRKTIDMVEPLTEYWKVTADLKRICKSIIAKNKTRRPNRTCDQVTKNYYRKEKAGSESLTRDKKELE